MPLRRSESSGAVKQESKSSLYIMLWDIYNEVWETLDWFIEVVQIKWIELPTPAQYKLKRHFRPKE